MSGPTTKRDYWLKVFPPNLDIEDETDPIVYAKVSLDDAEYSLLDSQLYALEGEDYIGSYYLTEWAEPMAMTTTDVLGYIVSQLADEDADGAQQLWHSRRG